MLPAAWWLEVDLTGDLHDASAEVGVCARDKSERCATEGGVRATRVGVVEEVEGFTAKLEAYRLPDGEVLEE